MFRIQRWLLSAIALVVAVAPMARAADSPLSQIPAKTPLILHINGIEKAQQRLGKMISNALPDQANNLISAVDIGLKQLLKGRDTKGIVKDGHAFLLVSDLTNLFESPEIGVLVPVSSYAEFRDSFLTKEERKTLKKDDGGFDLVTVEGKDEPICLIDRKSYVLVASDKDAAKAFMKKTEFLEGKISDETKKALLGSDVSVYVNLQSINDAYGAQIKAIKALIDLALNMGGGMQGLDKKQIEMIKGLFDGILQIFDDGVAAVLGLEFRPEGVNLKIMAQFGPKTDTNNFLKNLKTSKLEELGKLPLGQMSYSGMKLDPKLAKALAMLISEVSADDEDDDVKKKLEKAAEALAEAELQSQFSTTDLPQAGLQISIYKDPVKGAAAHLDFLKALTKSSTFSNVPLKGKPEIKENAEELGGFKFHSVKMAFDFDKALAELPEGIKEATKASMARMLGGEKTNIWFGTDGKQVVQITAKDWAAAKAIFAKYREGSKTIDSDDSYTLTRKNLPAETTIIALADTPRLVYVMFEMVKEMAQAIPGFPGGMPNIKPLEGKPAYLGIALTLKAEHASIDIFVPTTAVQAVRKLLAPLFEGDR